MPIAYGPKDRYLARQEQNPDLLKPISITYPMIAYEIDTISYDNSRKLTTVNKKRMGDSANGSFITQFYPVPYNLNIKLSIIGRNYDDANQIVEQILPYFTPSWTIPINLIEPMQDTTNIKITLTSINQDIVYDNKFTDAQYVLWDLTFTLFGYFYGNTTRTGLIKDVITNLFIPTTNTAAEGVGITPLLETIDIRPGLTANGQPTSDINNTVPISQINANSDYGIITILNTANND